MNEDRHTPTPDCPDQGSIWVRKISGRAWAVLYCCQHGLFIKLVGSEPVELECIELETFREFFEPIVVV